MELILYGLWEVMRGNKRGIVIFWFIYLLSGKYVGYWLGDNDSKWFDVYDFIIGFLEFNFFGILYIGVDICGFFGYFFVEFCERWM